jgi:L-idonate 5-dehydrogenase
MDRDRACVIHGAHDLRVEDVDRQPVGPDQVEVAIDVGGICGSDLSYFMKGAVGDFRVREPMVLGHEVVGIVAKAGDGVDPRMVGGRVAVNPSRPCGRCVLCQAGRDNICGHGSFLGSAAPFPHVQGGFREHLVIQASQLVPIPRRLSFETAVFAEPLAVAIHALHRAGDPRDRAVIVIGAGPIGALLTLVARHRGCASLTVADLRDEPLQAARLVGATRTVNTSAGDDDLEPGDIVFEASGAPAGLATALRSVSRGGSVVQVGLLPGVQVPLPANVIATTELTLRGSFRFTGAEFREALTLLAKGMDVSPLLTARIALDSALEAFTLASDRAASMKVQLVVGGR